MSDLNASRETRAQAILDCCERVARGIDTNYSDKADSDAVFIDACVQRLFSKLRYLAPRAAAGWRKQFGDALDQAHSMRVEHVEVPYKEGVRARKMRCMACGRFEKNCTNRLDIAGPFVGGEWCGPTQGLADAYEGFKDSYGSVYEENFLEECVECDQLPPQDLGSYMVGETCLRKAQLYFQVRTLLSESVYDAARQCEAVELQFGSLDKRELYTCDAEAVQDFLNRLDQLELAVADERRPTPALETDPTYWDIIDAAREGASGGDENTEIRLLRERAYETMGLEEESQYQDEEASRPHRQDDAEYAEEDLYRRGDREDDEDECVGGPRNEGRKLPAAKPKRRCVVDDSDEESFHGSDDEASLGGSYSDEEEEDEDHPVCARANAKSAKGGGGKKAAAREGMRRSRRQRGKRAGSSSEEEAAAPPPKRARAAAPAAAEASAPSSAAPASAPSGGGRCAASRPGPRSAPENASSLASAQRIPGERLPARRAALLGLMGLQAKLMREGRDAEAAICTAAIFNYQDLLSRVEELAHSSEI